MGASLTGPSSGFFSPQGAGIITGGIDSGVGLGSNSSAFFSPQGQQIIGGGAISSGGGGGGGAGLAGGLGGISSILGGLMGGGGGGDASPGLAAPPPVISRSQGGLGPQSIVPLLSQIRQSQIQNAALGLGAVSSQGLGDPNSAVNDRLFGFI